MCWLGRLGFRKGRRNTKGDGKGEDKSSEVKQRERTRDHDDGNADPKKTWGSRITHLYVENPYVFYEKGFVLTRLRFRSS
jgi:hypothetical protein